MQTPFYYYTEEEINLLENVLVLFIDFEKKHNQNQLAESIVGILENIKNKEYLSNRKEEELCEILSLYLSGIYSVTGFQNIDHNKIKYIILKTIMIYDKINILTINEFNPILLNRIKKQIKNISISDLADDETDFYAKLFGYNI